MNFQTIQQLRAALQNPELLGTLPPVLAVGLGVIPLLVADDYALIGHVPHVCSDAFKFLERYYGREIVTVKLHDGAAREAIWKAYARDNPINHDTFPDPDFLLKPEYESKLLNEKEDEIGPLGCDLAADEIVFLETTYFSDLVNIDRREEQDEVVIDDAVIPFRIIDSVPVVFDEVIPEDAFLVERRNYCYIGAQDNHGISRTTVHSLPHVIHPSEIQLTQIGADGSLTFYIYDHLERVQAGQKAYFEFPYHFISFGYRYSRVLALNVHSIVKCRREEIRYTDQEHKWDLDDVERWFNPIGK
ncbi:MAG: hypothetical protein O3B01_28515 [Planctomycetota bacterium]|nr:hypothetical protein [Planctomycetota bacterium]MDA1142526.1 hypothetical protein [Planctomycetota bacterium]